MSRQKARLLIVKTMIAEYKKAWLTLCTEKANQSHAAEHWELMRLHQGYTGQYEKNGVMRDETVSYNADEHRRVTEAYDRRVAECQAAVQEAEEALETAINDLTER